MNSQTMPATIDAQAIPKIRKSTRASFHGERSFNGIATSREKVAIQ
jgi:hypothetical protein